MMSPRRSVVLALCAAVLSLSACDPGGPGVEEGEAPGPTPAEDDDGGY